ncbi:uncharacterized protein [Macrobrachium rosenbergii]|uniref:uncharacterized protein n=1 Tax=Macrobrachium rosenbergii TaxID=79674 RepID=UPI0034D3F8B0
MKGGGALAGAWALLLLVFVDVIVALPSSPTATKRSDENIQFGNQQNKPVSVLDEDALPGAFPSSETTENTEHENPTADPEGDADEAHSSVGKIGSEDKSEAHDSDEDTEDDHRQESPPPPPPPPPPRPEPTTHEGRHLPPVTAHLSHRQVPIHREEMISDLPPVALASRWRPPSEFYNPNWGMPSLYGAVDDGTFPARRKRRSIHHRQQKPDPRKVLQVSLKALRTGHRHKRDLHDLNRIRRDLRNIDLDKLRREVDVMELLAMLGKVPKHRNPGFATVTYAPMAPAPPRFAPQPKLFPDYDEEEEEEEEDDEDEEGMGYLRQNTHPPLAPSRVMLPHEDRIWRRSGGYGLSAMPGFKRSAFRANTPAPPIRALNPGDVYSLAAMLGAELDPITHRLRRAAM